MRKTICFIFADTESCAKEGAGRGMVPNGVFAKNLGNCAQHKADHASGFMDKLAQPDNVFLR